MQSSISKIFVFGLGAIGSNLITKLAIQYPHITFYGIDYDTVEDRNINTQAYFLYHTSMSKVSAIYSVLGSKIKKFTYIPINKKIVSTDDITTMEIGNDTLLIDCFDNSEARSLFSNISFNCIHIGFSPEYTAEVIWNEHYSVPGDVDPDNNDICDVTEAVSFISFIVAFAAMNISSFLEKGEKNDYIITNKYIINKL